MIPNEADELGGMSQIGLCAELTVAWSRGVGAGMNGFGGKDSVVYRRGLEGSA